MAVLVREHDGNAVSHRRHERIGRAEVDADGEPVLAPHGLVGFGDLQERHQRGPGVRRRNRCGGSSPVHPVEHDVDVVDDLGQEAQLADGSPRVVPCAIVVEQRRDAYFELRAPRCALRRGSLRARACRRCSARRRPPRAVRAAARGIRSGAAVSVSSNASMPCSDRRYCARATGSLSARYASLTLADDWRARAAAPCRRRWRDDRDALRPAAPGRRGRAPPDRSGNAPAGRTTGNGCARNRSSPSRSARQPSREATATGGSRASSTLSWSTASRR